MTLEFDDIAHSLHVVECGGGSSDKNGMYLLLTSSIHRVDDKTDGIKSSDGRGKGE